MRHAANKTVEATQVRALKGRVSHLWVDIRLVSGLAHARMHVSTHPRIHAISGRIDRGFIPW